MNMKYVTLGLVVLLTACADDSASEKTFLETVGS